MKFKTTTSICIIVLSLIVIVTCLLLYRLVYISNNQSFESFESSTHPPYTIVAVNKEHIDEIVSMYVNEKIEGTVSASEYKNHIRHIIEYSQKHPIKVFSIAMIKPLNGENKTIGFVTVNRSQDIIDRGYRVPYLSDLIVDKSFRKQGIANKMLEYCENICDNQWNEKYLYLWVKTDNESAIKLYYGRNYIPLHFAKGKMDTVQSVLNGINVDQNYTLEECMDASKEYDRILFRKSLV